MPDLNTYLGWTNDGALEDWYEQLPRDISLMLGHRGVSITLFRPSTESTLTAQTVLLVPAGQNTNASLRTNEAGKTAVEQLVMIGDDTLNVQKGDRFAYQSPNNRHNYEVVRVEKMLDGMIQGFVEHIS